MIHNISTISKHLLEKSEAICCLRCPCLFGNVTWLHTNTSSQSFPLPSLWRDAERWRQGDSTRLHPPAVRHGLTRPPRDWLRGPDVSRCAGSKRVQMWSRSDRGCLPGSAARRRPAMSWQSVCWRFIISRLQTARWPLRPDRWSHSATWLNICPRGASAHILCHHYFIPSRSISECSPDLGAKAGCCGKSNFSVCVCVFSRQKQTASAVIFMLFKEIIFTLKLDIVFYGGKSNQSTVYLFFSAHLIFVLIVLLIFVLDVVTCYTIMHMYKY